MSVLLLVEMDNGTVCAAVFQTVDEARNWEDAHESEMAGTVRGVAQQCPRRELLVTRDARSGD